MSYRIPFASLAAIFAVALGAPANVSAQSAPSPEVAWQQATVGPLVEGEGIQVVLIVAWRSVDGARVSNGPLTIPYTVSGNATPNVDYRLEPAGSMVFEDGREYAPLRIAIVDDDQHEPARDTLYIHLTPGDGYTLHPSLGTLRVLLGDNDAANPVPAITSVTRDASVKGKDVVLVVRGSGFLASSAVRWAGETLPTTYVSATELRADITKKAANAAREASVAVTVFNPAPGGGESAGHAFTLGR